MLESCNLGKFVSEYQTVDMLGSKTGQLVSRGIKSYFEETSLHGFRYLSVSRSWFFKLFWLASLILAFVCCAYLIALTVAETNDHPIITNVEEVTVNEIASPAISLLVPKTMNFMDYNVRMLNTIKACEPIENRKDNALLTRRAFVTFMALYNSDIRIWKGTEIPDDLEFLSNVTSPFHKFCSALMGKNEDERNNILKKIRGSIDVNSLVYDLDKILDVSLETDDQIGNLKCSTNKADYHNVADLNRTLFDWINLTSPVRERLTRNITCSERYKTYPHLR